MIGKQFITQQNIMPGKLFFRNTTVMLIWVRSRLLSWFLLELSYTTVWAYKQINWHRINIFYFKTCLWTIKTFALMISFTLKKIYNKCQKKRTLWMLHVTKLIFEKKIILIGKIKKYTCFIQIWLLRLHCLIKQHLRKWQFYKPKKY